MKYKIIVVLTLVVSLLSGCTARKEMKIMSIDGYGSEDTVLIKDESFLEDVDYKTFKGECQEKTTHVDFIPEISTKKVSLIYFTARYAYMDTKTETSCPCSSTPSAQ